MPAWRPLLRVGPGFPDLKLYPAGWGVCQDRRAFSGDEAPDSHLVAPGETEQLFVGTRRDVARVPQGQAWPLPYSVALNPPSCPRPECLLPEDRPKSMLAPPFLSKLLPGEKGLSLAVR